MTLELRCQCGQLQGRVDLARTQARAICYCRDCQAFARFLGQPGLLDAAGGTEILAMAPDGVHIDTGGEHLACMSMSPRGLLRWYAACCRTPLANTSRDPGLYYTGLVAACVHARPGELDAALGPADSLVANTGSATRPVKSAPLRFLVGGVRIFVPAILARLRGRRAAAPFFDAGGEPVREPQVVSREQREALQRG